MSIAPSDQRPRVPPSAAFAQTLARTVDYARHQSHRFATVEHLLLALCEDPDAGRVLSASVDVRQVMMDVAGFVGRIEDRAPPHQAVEPMFDAELSRILDYAAVATQQSGRTEISGAVVLAAIVGDERSPAATILRSQGLTFDEAIQILRQTARAPGGPEPVMAQPRPQPPMPEPVPPPHGQWSDGTGHGVYGLPAEHMRPHEPHRDALNGSGAYAPPTSYGEPYPAPRQISGPPSDYQPNATPRTQPPVRRDSRSSGSVMPLTEIDADRLAAMLPDTINCGAGETIELSVSRADVESLGASLVSPTGAARPDLVVGRALTMRLRSADGRVVIEPVTPETQWIDARDTYATDDLGWRWTIAGLKPGTARVTLAVTARAIAIDGMAADSALPDLKHELRVTTSWARQGRRLMVILAALAAGAALALSSSMLIDLLAGVLRGGR